MKIKKRQGNIGNFDFEDLRDFFLTRHDWFGLFEDLPKDTLKQLWQQHKAELLALWNAPQGDWRHDPLFSNEHGPHIKCWAEEHLE